MKLIIESDEILEAVLVKVQEMFPDVTKEDLVFHGNTGAGVAVVCDLKKTQKVNNKTAVVLPPQKAVEEAEKAMVGIPSSEPVKPVKAPSVAPEPTPPSEPTGLKLKPVDSSKPKKSLFASLAKN